MLYLISSRPQQVYLHTKDLVILLPCLLNYQTNMLCPVNQCLLISTSF